MKKTKTLCHGHRFPASVISHPVRWHFRFQLCLWDIKELLFERGEPWLLWRAVDQHGAELDILLQKRRDKAAAKLDLMPRSHRA
jgi:putative transposase